MDERRTFRCEEHLYRRAKAKAATDGTTLTAVIVDALEQYVDGPPALRITTGEPVTIATMTEEEYAQFRATKPAGLEPPVACTALIGNEQKPCTCSGYKPQRQSPTRCGECGHLRGLHE